MMKIRTYQDTDQNNVISLWKDCGLVKPQNDPVKDIERKLLVDPDLFLVGVDEGKMIASVMGGYEGHRGWINYLAVSPNHQRQGWGEEIMKAIEVLIKDKGCPKINLMVRNTNLGVVSFYQKIGYGDDHIIGLGKRLEYDD